MSDLDLRSYYDMSIPPALHAAPGPVRSRARKATQASTESPEPVLPDPEPPDAPEPAEPLPPEA